MPYLRRLLTSRHPYSLKFNPGLLLRWDVALCTMESLSLLERKQNTLSARLAAEFRKAWVLRMEHLVEGWAPYLSLVRREPAHGYDSAGVFAGKTHGIVCVQVWVRDDSKTPYDVNFTKKNRHEKVEYGEGDNTIGVSSLYHRPLRLEEAKLLHKELVFGTRSMRDEIEEC